MLFSLPAPAALLLPATQPCPIATHKKHMPKTIFHPANQENNLAPGYLRISWPSEPKTSSNPGHCVNPKHKSLPGPRAEFSLQNPSLFPLSNECPQNILLHSLMPPSPFPNLSSSPNLIHTFMSLYQSYPLINIHINYLIF